ncbi:hypothetical protein [Marinobacterium sedimentorum]|uniref:hypothetical protein n=1 Tax=Marinobacterium sedimentorum TaxID=2927804 RepID=UPI0020C5DDFD|nr:hypothetical protein [Marinobacterium sedimentorum]MCP8687733.1 hypothetical protein [Marinobacterium sedimentorum]
MLNQTVIIEYIDADGKKFLRLVEALQLDSDRFEAWCHICKAPRTLRYERLSAVFDKDGNPLDRDAWVASAAGISVPFVPGAIRQRTGAGARLILRFSGFESAERLYLKAVAEQHDFRVIGDADIDADIDYLVAGPYVQLTEKEAAKNNAVSIISKDELFSFIETGVL